jgi:hypothetical protein
VYKEKVHARRLSLETAKKNSYDGELEKMLNNSQEFWKVFDSPLKRCLLCEASGSYQPETVRRCGQNVS